MLLLMHLTFMSHLDICMCLERVSLEVSSILFVITPCVLSSSKKGRLLAQRPLALVLMIIKYM